jgi:hypothetical protein
MQDAPGAPEPTRAPWSRTLAIGCFMVPLGFFSGGMIAVLVSKVVAFATRAPGCDGVPTCNWLEHMLVGAALGATSLPALVIWTLRASPRPER